MLTEEAAPALGGFAAHQHHLGLVRVIIACAIGGWAMGVLLYALGRWRGHWVRKRFRGEGRLMTRMFVIVRRSPLRSVFAVRFAFGFRIVMPLACGAARLRIMTYLVGTAIASVLWSTLYVLLGWGFGETALLVLGHVRRYEDLLAVTLVLLVTLGVLVAIQRRRPGRLSVVPRLARAVRRPPAPSPPPDRPEALPPSAGA
jgi:membrane protein DedA with SNARE-associated domain